MAVVPKLTALLLWSLNDLQLLGILNKLGRAILKYILRQYLSTVVVDQWRSKLNVPRTCFLLGCTCVVLDPSLPFHNRPCCILDPSVLLYCPLKLDTVDNSSWLTNQAFVIENEKCTLSEEKARYAPTFEKSTLSSDIFLSNAVFQTSIRRILNYRGLSGQVHQRGTFFPKMVEMKSRSWTLGQSLPRVNSPPPRPFSHPLGFFSRRIGLVCD